MHALKHAQERKAHVLLYATDCGRRAVYSTCVTTGQSTACLIGLSIFGCNRLQFNETGAAIRSCSGRPRAIDGSIKFGCMQTSRLDMHISGCKSRTVLAMTSSKKRLLALRTGEYRIVSRIFVNWHFSLQRDRQTGF